MVYIAAFPEDKIIPNARGKLLFTAGDYNAETHSYDHIFGKGEEIFAVKGSGLSSGNIYTRPQRLRMLPKSPYINPCRKPSLPKKQSSKSCANSS